MHAKIVFVFIGFIVNTITDILIRDTFVQQSSPYYRVNKRTDIVPCAPYDRYLYSIQLYRDDRALEVYQDLLLTVVW